MVGPRAKMEERGKAGLAGRPATAVPRAASRGPARASEQACEFFFAEAQPKRRRFGWVSAKKKEKAGNGPGEGGKATGPVFFWAGKWERAVGLFPMDVFFFFFFVFIFS